MTTATIEKKLDNESPRKLARLGFCRVCGLKFENGQTVIYRSHKRHYHGSCWTAIFYDVEDDPEDDPEPLVEINAGYDQ